MDWFGIARICFIHSPVPRRLKTHDGNDMTLLQICKKSIEPCILNPFLFNGHLQTIWAALQGYGPCVYYCRKVFEANHPTYTGSFAVDFVAEKFDDEDATLPKRTRYFSDDQLHSLASEDSTPMVIVLPGLTGGSNEGYIRHTVTPLLSRGWKVCVLNARGCANSEITTGILFNARATWDLRQVSKNFELANSGF